MQTLYVLKTCKTNTYKIGITKYNAKHRAKSIQRTANVDVEPLFEVKIKKADTVEKYLHNKFKIQQDTSISGSGKTEYFKLSTFDILFVRLYVFSVWFKEKTYTAFVYLLLISLGVLIGLYL